MLTTSLSPQTVLPGKLFYSQAKIRTLASYNSLLFDRAFQSWNFTLICYFSSTYLLHKTLWQQKPRLFCS